MSRYFSRPRAEGTLPGSAEDTWFTDPLLPSVDVPEHKPSFTGLLDSKGKEIWRSPRPMGFGRDGEW
jgi:hypothetical protein